MSEEKRQADKALELAKKLDRQTVFASGEDVLIIARALIACREPVDPTVISSYPVSLYECPCLERVRSWHKFCPNCGHPINWRKA